MQAVSQNSTNATRFSRLPSPPRMKMELILDKCPFRVTDGTRNMHGAERDDPDRRSSCSLSFAPFDLFDGKSIHADALWHFVTLSRDYRLSTFWIIDDQSWTCSQRIGGQIQNFRCIGFPSFRTNCALKLHLIPVQSATWTKSLDVPNALELSPRFAPILLQLHAFEYILYF